MGLEVLAGAKILADDVSRIVPQCPRKTADESLISNATLQNDDHLFVTLVANGIYRHFLNLTYQSNSTPAFSMDFTLPASATMVGNLFGCGGSGAAFQWGTMGTSLVGAAGTGGNTGLQIHGMIIVGATAGTARVRWAQSVSNATTTYVRSGSFWEVRRVA